MLFSIAISTYEANGKGVNYLKKNLNQIGNQTYKNLEIIVSDHSKDDKIKNLCNTFDNLNIYYFKNTDDYGSSSSNTNNAINKCRGSLIKIMFIDDYFENKDAIKLIINEFDKNPNKKWLANSYFHTDNSINYHSIFHPSWNPCMIFQNTIGCPSAITIRNDIEIRFDKNLLWFMDTDFYHRIYIKYGEPIFLLKPIIVNLIHNDQVTNRITDEIVLKEKNYLINKYNISKKFWYIYHYLWKDKTVLDTNLESTLTRYT